MYQRDLPTTYQSLLLTPEDGSTRLAHTRWMAYEWSELFTEHPRSFIKIPNPIYQESAWKSFLSARDSACKQTCPALCAISKPDIALPPLSAYDTAFASSTVQIDCVCVLYDPAQLITLWAAYATAAFILDPLQFGDFQNKERMAGDDKRRPKVPPLYEHQPHRLVVLLAVPNLPLDLRYVPPSMHPLMGVPVPSQLPAMLHQQLSQLQKFEGQCILQEDSPDPIGAILHRVCCLLPPPVGTLRPLLLPSHPCNVAELSCRWKTLQLAFSYCSPMDINLGQQTSRELREALSPLHVFSDSYCRTYSSCWHQEEWADKLSVGLSTPIAFDATALRRCSKLPVRLSMVFEENPFANWDKPSIEVYEQFERWFELGGAPPEGIAEGSGAPEVHRARNHKVKLEVRASAEAAEEPHPAAPAAATLTLKMQFKRRDGTEAPDVAFVESEFKTLFSNTGENTEWAIR